MRKFLYLVTIVFVLGCSKDDEIQEVVGEGNYATKQIRVEIDLPQNSNYSSDELTVSTLFTEKGKVSNGVANVEVFDNDAMELIFASNPDGNVVLMTYLNPKSGEEVILNVQSTAQTLAMLHPWTMHFSHDVKLEIFKKLPNEPGFEEYMNKVNDMILSGETAPLNNDFIATAVEGFRASYLKKVEENKKPLKFEAEAKEASITNKSSSLAYGFRIYDKNGIPQDDVYVVKGVTKEILTYSNFLALLQGKVVPFQATSEKFNPPMETGSYSIKARNGFAFDNTQENEEAAFRNGVNMASSIIGILSSTLQTIFKGGECALGIGKIFIQNTQTVFKLYMERKASVQETMEFMISTFLQRNTEIYQVASNCKKFVSTQSKFSNLVKNLSLIKNFENGATLLFYLTDLGLYDSKIDFCFEKTEQDVLSCDATRLFAHPPYEGLVELSLEGQKISTLFEESGYINRNRTTYSASTEEIITIIDNSSPELYKININTQVVENTPISSTYEYITASSDGRLFGYQHQKGLIEEISINTGAVIDTIVQFDSSLYLSDLVYSNLTEEILAQGKSNDGVESLFKIDVNKKAKSSIPFQINPIEDLIISEDGRLFALVGYDKFIEVNLDDGSVSKTITENKGFYYGTFLNSTNEIVGGRDLILYRINVETGEVSEEKLTQRYEYFLSTR